MIDNHDNTTIQEQELEDEAYDYWFGEISNYGLEDEELWDKYE